MSTMSNIVIPCFFFLSSFVSRLLNFDGLDFIEGGFFLQALGDLK